LGRYGEFGYALWATATNLLMRYGHSKIFGNALSATVASWVMRYSRCSGFGYVP
jgi:hypothetical protein